MAQFNTIVPISRKDWPEWRIPYGGTCTGDAILAPASSPAYPIGSVVHYTPESTTITKSDPTKGTKRNWERIKKSGEISFTPYSVSKTTTQYFVVEKKHDLASWRWWAAACGGVVSGQLGPEEGHTVYQENVNFFTLGLQKSTTLGQKFRAREALFNEEVQEAISTTQQAAFAQAMSTYDLLTELAESKETLKYMQSVVGGAAEALRSFAHTDEQTYRRARGLTAKALLKSSDKALRRLGSRWMEYRYAIMPLVYTLKDINELLGKSDSVYKSGRDRADVRMEITQDDHEWASEGTNSNGVGSIEARVSSLVKSRYDRGALQRVLAQTAFNPFKTGWELVPYSFVVDWFLNVGDAITAATAIDLSTQTLGVTAIKRKSIYEVIHGDTTVDRSSRSISAWNGLGPYNLSYEFRRSVRAPLQRVSVESYDRFIFTRPKPQVHLDPFLNWKRYLDGLVLSYQPIKKLLRSL